MNRETAVKTRRRTKLSANRPTNTHGVIAAAQSGADIVQLDLENSTPADEKAAGRDAVLAALTERDFGGSEVWVRVNGFDSGEIEHDVDVVSAGAPDALVLAKATSFDQVQGFAELIDAAERKHGLPDGRIEIGVVIESPQALVNVESIVTAHTRVSSLSIGMNDLVASCGYRPDRNGPGFEALYARSKCVIAARLAGIASCDAAYPLDDPIGTLRNAEEALRLGFTTKTVHSAAQVRIVHSLFELEDLTT